MEQAVRGRRLASASSLLITDLPRHIESRAQITAASGAGKSKTSSGPVMKPMKNGGSRNFEEVTEATTALSLVVSVVVESTDGRIADSLQVVCAGCVSCMVARGFAPSTDGGEKTGGLWMRGEVKRGALSTVGPGPGFDSTSPSLVRGGEGGWTLPKNGELV